MGDTSIQWTDRTWNPVRGCSIVSDGCKNCYAMRQAHRFSGPGGAYEGLTQMSKRGPVWTGAARFVPAMLAEPIKWRKPQRVFVNSMSDLFHDDITDEQIAAVFGVMATCPQHTFQVLTKRPERMLAWFNEKTRVVEVIASHLPSLRPERKQHYYLAQAVDAAEAILGRSLLGLELEDTIPISWPLPNVWLGVSAENQKAADERIPLLLQTPAAVRFVSAEPLLGPLDLEAYLERVDGALNWVIVGGESGPRSRMCALPWVRDIVEQTAEARVACFVKQIGSWPAEDACVQVRESWLTDRAGGDPAEWEPGLRVRQMPDVRRG